MAAATMTSKGQVTIPKAIRERLHLRAGDVVEFVPLADGSVQLVARTRSLEDLYGMLGDGPSGITLEDMEAAIAEGAVHSMR